MKSVIAIPFARKLSGRTNYRRRLALLKSQAPRLIVRKTLGSIILQVAQFQPIGDKIHLTVTSKRLKEFGWNHGFKNIPAAYLTGMLAAKVALAAGMTNAVPDIGVQSVTKGGKIFAAIKGAKDAGLQTEVSDEILPAKEAINGTRLKLTADFEKVKAAIAAWQPAPKGGKNAATKK